jgi:hypothetical protein
MRITTTMVPRIKRVEMFLKTPLIVPSPARGTGANLTLWVGRDAHPHYSRDSR